MRRLTIAASVVLVYCLVFTNAGIAADKSTIAPLTTSGPVTSPPVIDYRWADLAQNPYAQAYVAAYSYDDAVVTVTYETGAPTFTGHLSATNLKPNFAYQIKLVGKPEALFDPVTAGGDDAANERIGYAGRWWEVAPGVGNRDDAYYETFKNNPAYVFEAYLLFDFFLTDASGNAEVDFALNSSYHVLFWDWQGSPDSCDQPLRSTIVSGSATDPAYATDIGPTPAGVYPQIERLCNGTTALPLGTYHCRFLLTEESFHTADGNWAPALIADDIVFNVGAGVFPPTMESEPAYTAGADNTVAWGLVPDATEYFVAGSTTSDFLVLLPESGWTTDRAVTFGGLADGQLYHYRVKARDAAQSESAWSSVVSSTQDATAPASAVGPLPATYLGVSLSVPYTANDAVSGVAAVALYYRVDGGPYQIYGGGAGPSPIHFMIPGDGNYDFYTVATDKVGHVEAPPGIPDASSVLTVGQIPAPVGNPDYIDIGTLTSENQVVMGEAPHNMVGWGPTAPGTIGGSYGGIAPGSCRPVWSPTEFDPPPEPWADIDLNFGPLGAAKTLWVRYLDGASTDDQSYLVDGGFLGSIATGDQGENWYWQSFDVSAYEGVHTLRIEATQTDPPGPLWDPYGQVAIDIISICDASALFAALPLDPAPITCGQSRQVAFRFTRGCEAIRGYSLRVQASDGLSFDAGDVVMLDPSGTGAFSHTVTQNATDDWTITYTIIGDAALPDGIPSEADLFTIAFGGVADGAGIVHIESVSVDPLLVVPPPVLATSGASITVDCSAPTGGLQINGGATATSDLNVNLLSTVNDATGLQMRFVNDPDDWSGPEDGWIDYAADYFWSLAPGPPGVRTVRAEYRDAVGQVLASVDQISFTSGGPGAVSALHAEPGNLKVAVSWQDPTEATTGLEVWRGLWAADAASGLSAYPEYGGLPADVIPVRPESRAAALISPQWELAGTVLPGEQAYTDVDGVGGLARGVYYYEVFAVDAQGVYGPPAVQNDRATSYLLGDLNGDGAITVGPDINAGLALCYGAGDGDLRYDSACDVGPTDDYGGRGIPVPDDVIDFNDLMIFALNFDTVLSKESTPADAVVRFTWTEVETGTWSLGLQDSEANLKGLRLQAELPSDGMLTLAGGSVLTALECPVFLRNIDQSGLDVGLALLADGAFVSGRGELLRVTVKTGYEPRNVVIDARNRSNVTVSSTIETAEADHLLPVRWRVFPNYPNPFNPATRIEFELPRTEFVTIAVFGLDGRRIATITDRTLAAGRHTVIWNGRDAQGDAVASGTYVYRLQAGTYTKTGKMTLLK